jgi:hypothetical protein
MARDVFTGEPFRPAARGRSRNTRKTDRRTSAGLVRYSATRLKR